MNPNSIQIYREKVEPTIKKRHERVFYALKELGEATMYDVAEKLNVQVHTVSGRFSELSGVKEYGRPIIESVGQRDNKYGNACTLWKIRSVSKAEQTNLF